MEATVEETVAALRVPFPEPVDFPEQTLRERIASFNALLKKSEVPPERLRIGVIERSESKAALLDMKVPAFTAQTATPRDILVHCCDALIVRYVIRDNGMTEIAPSEG